MASVCERRLKGMSMLLGVPVSLFCMMQYGTQAFAFSESICLSKC